MISPIKATLESLFFFSNFDQICIKKNNLIRSIILGTIFTRDDQKVLSPCNLGMTINRICAIISQTNLPLP